MEQTSKPGQIDWIGFEKILVHAAIIALAAVFVYVEQLFVGHNFGAYQVLALAINSIVIKAAQKFFGNYSVTVPVPENTETTTQ